MKKLGAYNQYLDFASQSFDSKPDTKQLVQVNEIPKTDSKESVKVNEKK